MQLEDTIVAAATPPGESAIALIRLSGSLCPKLACDAFARNNLPARQALLGHYRKRDGVACDQVLFTVFEEHASYTGEPMLEIATHGNPLIVRLIIDDLLTRGCRLAEPGEFTRRAFMAGKLDLTQAEAVAELIAARSERALQAAQRQLGGELAARMDGIRVRLLNALAQLEAYIDFPEEDIPHEDASGPMQEIAALRTDISALHESRRYHALLHEGVRTVIIGEPNAGKSSLLNALLGSERALVSEQPGTTRDFISESLMLDGHRIEITDTAGLRVSEDALERAGVVKTLETAKQADFYLLVVDSTGNAPALEESAQALFHVEQTIIVENKGDLPQARSLEDWLPEFPHVKISATAGTGLDALRSRWAEMLKHLCQTNGNDGLSVSTRQAEALARTLEALEAALEQHRRQSPSELIASELREALDFLGEITGKVDNEQMLDALFSNFCIGK